MAAQVCREDLRISKASGEQEKHPKDETPLILWMLGQKDRKETEFWGFRAGKSIFLSV